MQEIKTNSEYIIENVLSYRRKMTQQEVQQELMNIARLINVLGARINGSLVTTTFALEQTGTSPLMDMEILVPLDKEVNLPEPYIFKKLFHLKYAIYARHEGNPQYIQRTLNQMLEFIMANKLTQITSVYSVNVKDFVQGDSMDNMVTDLYIGVSPSVL